MTRVALVGLGAVAARIHLPAFRLVPAIDCVGACDPDPQRRAAAARWRIPAIYEDAAALLKAVKPEAVVIGAPPAAHRDLMLLALEHGAHVFCEKPFVLSSADADDVLAAAGRCGRTVAVNHQYRCMPIYGQVRRGIEAGEYGEPFLIQAWQQMFHPPSVETNWRAELVQSTLFEFGPHVLDLICFLFGELPDAVTAHIPRPRAEVPSDVVVALLLHFPHERVASVMLNRISHAPRRYLEMRVDCRDASIRVSYGGVARVSVTWSSESNRPVVRAGLVRGGEARIERGGRSRVLVREPREALASATAAKLQEFLATIARGTFDLTDARHARALIRLIECAYQSASLNRTVAFDADVLVR